MWARPHGAAGLGLRQAAAAYGKTGAATGTGLRPTRKNEAGTLKKQGRTLLRQSPTLFFREATLFSPKSRLVAAGAQAALLPHSGGTGTSVLQDMLPGRGALRRKRAKTYVARSVTRMWPLRAA